MGKKASEQATNQPTNQPPNQPPNHNLNIKPAEAPTSCQIGSLKSNPHTPEPTRPKTRPDPTHTRTDLDNGPTYGLTDPTLSN